ncbi:MAG TPA: sulfite exporter TauE/SafE family protein, partial [Thermoanaerobaculia bacterium]|nr:sulfite exporter TauE/SafE family protein [Thermoanaerobaculia bacterium]
RPGVALELFTVIGAIAGGAIAGVLSGSALTAMFAAVLIAIAIPMARGHVDSELDESAPAAPVSPLEASMRSVYVDPAAAREVRYQPRRLPLAMGISSFAGVLSGLLGIGGGLVIVPALVKLCGVPMKAAAATSNFMIGVTGVASALIYYGRGDFSPLVAAATALGVFAGSRAGAALAGRLDPAHTRRVFAGVMVLMAIQMILKAGGWWFV